MPDIRYVVISDMHLGAENSVLTNLKGETWETDNTKPSPVLVKLVECLRDVVSKNEGTQKPTLVLNGDLIELALTTTNDASMAFQRFIELVMPENGEPLFDKTIFFLGGNHDHNLWERSRNYHYLHYLRELQAGADLRDEIHCTRMFNPEPVPEILLNTLVQRYPGLQDVNITSAYPAHALISEDKQKCVIFCHGHYIESMYSLMTSLRSKIFPDRKEPQFFEGLEKENYAWVDFFWSTLGRSGAVGKDISLIYDKIQDPAQVKIMINNISESISGKKKNFLTRWVENFILKAVLNFTVGKLAKAERNEPDTELSPDATNGLKILMEKYVLNQMMDELNGFMPSNVSFIFGHTHKPFLKLMQFKGYAAPVKVYNSGGWVVDTMKDQKLTGGSVILVDEHCDVVSLQMYKEGNYNSILEELKGVNEPSCDFYQRISGLIDMKSEPWSGFSKIAEIMVNVRHDNLAAIAKSRN